MKVQIQEQSELSQQQLIRRNGYEFTKPAKFILPTASNPTSFIRSLFQLLSNSDKQMALFDPHYPKSLTVLNEKQAILFHSNKLTVMRVSVGEQGLAVQSRASFLLDQKIKRVVCGYYGNRQEKSEPFDQFAVQYQISSSISLFRVDHQGVSLVNETKESQKIMAMRFTSNSELVVLLNNGKVSSYSIKQGRLRKSKVNLRIFLEDDHTLKNGEICTTGSNSQLKILLFYLVHSNKNQRCQLHLKEYNRDSSGNLQQLGTYYDIFQAQNLHTLSESMVIYCFRESVLIHQGLTVSVLQKRFGKYVRSDVISQLSSAKRVALIQRGSHMFLCSFGEGEIQLWQVIIKDVGCGLQLLDVIEADGAALAERYIKSWIFVQNKKPEFVLAVDAGSRQVEFFLTKKLDKLSKLTSRVRREEARLEGIQQKGQKWAFASKLRQMQQLGGKLGFRRKQFYLKLWQQSDKNSAHIVQFLLACKDFKVIFNELSQFLRVKKLTVTETIRILKRVQESLLEQMTRSLELELIRQFLKTNFQRRKLKLYSGEIQLDFQQYQDIYEASIFDLVQRSIDLRLFPEKFKHDIVWKEQTQEKPIEIPYILREFRLIILEDYPGFLLKLLQPYGSHLRQVVEAYPYLLPQFPLKISVVRQELVMLSNIYEAEKIEEQQYSWLGYIRENEWQRQASSIDFLHRHLFDHHSTSLIADKLRQFTEGTWCGRSKYSRHVLVEARRKEFEAKLPGISDGSSLLFLCEWANRLALQTGRRSDSEAIVQAMHRHNHLPLQQYYNYRLFCTLHHLLIKEKLMHSCTTVIELMQMPPQKLVACFFLGDRQRIALLFQSVSKMYPSKQAFNRIVEAFVNSGQCSKVELQMLTNYLRRSGQQYQQENQQLIAIVLRGFLKRIQVREKDKALDFLNLFRSISLAQPLLITLALFQTVKADCVPILKLFQLSSLTYETVINDPRTVITSIVHDFFSSAAVRMKSLYIEGREVGLSFAKNIFVVVLYLKDKIYSYGQEMQLYMIFCEAVLGWNQFDLVRQCFGGEIIIDEQEYLPQEFAAIVVDYMLNKYYEDETLLYCQETNDHINRLLTLIDESAQTSVVERSKMQFVALLQPLGQAISVQYMQLIRQQWQKEEQRASLFRDIVDLFPQVDFHMAIDLYHALQRMRTGNLRVQVKTDQFVQLALYICGKYVKSGQFERICEVISFLNAGELFYRARYSFMIECFIQVMHDRLQKPHHLSQSFVKVDKLAQLAYCKELIDYFLTHFYQVDVITQFFASRFELPQGEQADSVQIDSSLCFNQTLQELSRKQVWDLIVQRAISSSETFTRSQTGRKGKNGPGSNPLDTKTILFTYYFICNILHSSHYLFQLDDISYNHVENVHILAQLSKRETLRTAINFKSIYRQYLKGLFKIYVLLGQRENGQVEESLPVMQKRISMDAADMKIAEIRNMDDSKLVFFVTDLPSGSSKNQQLTRAMKKLIVLFQSAYSPSQERQKVVRLPTSKTVVQHEQTFFPLQLQQQNGNLKQSLTQVGHPQQPKTYRFVQFEKMKRQVVSKSNMVSERLLIGKVIDQLQNTMNGRQEMSSDSFIEEKLTINRIMAQQKESADEEQIGEVLEEMNMEKQNELIEMDLSGMHSLQYDSAQIEQIKQLIQAKEYQKITSKFEVKTILKAIHTQFYKKSQAPIRPKKRIVRSNTLKETTLHSRLIILLQTLDRLKLYGGSSKARLLRSCLTTISSEELQQIQVYLLGVFTLKVLLDTAKNNINLSKMILSNAKESCLDLELQKTKLVIRVIQSFMNKCKEQARARRHPQRSISQTHQTAELYYEYIIKLNNSDKPQKEKEEQLTQIMNLLQKDDLLAIHERISEALSTGDLYICYLQLIHRLYVGER